MRINCTSSEIPRVNGPQNIPKYREMILGRLYNISDGVDEIAQRQACVCARAREYVCACEWSCYIRLTVTPLLCRRIADERENSSRIFSVSVQAYWISCFSRSQTWTWSTTNIKVVSESNFLINAHLSLSPSSENVIRFPIRVFNERNKKKKE